MGKFCVRPATSKDIDAICNVERLCFIVPWSRQSFQLEIEKNLCARYFVAQDADFIVGYGGMWLVLDEAHITNVAVHPLYRRRGIGEGIIRALMKEANDSGVEIMTLEVRVSNKAAQNLYRKLGFIGAGIRKRYYSDNNEDALIMWNFDFGHVLKQGG